MGLRRVGALRSACDGRVRGAVETPRIVNTALRAPGFFEAEHTRLAAYLTRAGAPPAPKPDGLADALDPRVRRLAVNTWRMRMVNEHRSSSVFAQLAPQLMEASSPLAMQTVTLRMALDELHHAALCGRVIEALGADPSASAEPDLRPLPRHPDARSPVERALRNALFVGCLAETVAVALVSHERELAREGLVRWTLDQILGDEVSHARFGWQFVAEALPTLDPEARDRTGAYLRVAFGSLEREELPLLPLGRDPSQELAAQHDALGLCTGDVTRGLFYQTLSEVIVPRLESLGLDAARAWQDRPRYDAPAAQAA